jgi:hypothetical protein
VAAVTLTPADLEPFAVIDEVKAQAMIDDTLARAARLAPCILDEDFAYPDAAKAILRGVVLRWNESGTGITTTQTAGPYGMTVDTKTTPRFWPTEIQELQGMCLGTEGTGAFTVDMVGCGVVHADICSMYFGATYCSCGADIAGFPLWEVTA